MVNKEEILTNITLARSRKQKKRIDELESTTLGSLEGRISTLETKVQSLENMLANYEGHTHSYIDTTINDTTDGTGVETNTTKTTGGISQ